MDDSLCSLIDTFRASTVRPKYWRLQKSIYEMVRSGALPEGARLPPDSVLSQKLGISLGTVQKALTALMGEGMLTRAPRRGTVVSDVTVSADMIYVFRFRENDSDELLRPQVRMLSIAAETRPGPWCSHFGFDDLIRFDRLLRIALEPAVYSEVFAPLSIASDLLHCDPEDLSGTSLHQALERRSEKPFVRSRQFVRMGPLDETACAHLLLAPGTTGLIWDIASVSFDAAPVTFQRIQLPPTHRALEFDVELDLAAPRTRKTNQERQKQTTANMERTK